MVIPYPHISPTIFSIGPFALRWYGVMYLVAYVVGYRLVVSRIRRGVATITQPQLDSLVTYLVIGMLLGARLVYVFVYDFASYREHPLQALEIWHGGLSFHGAVLGMALACALFARREKLPFFAVTDNVAVVGAQGLFFGRLGNFINGELYGRPSNVPWAMIFPGDPLGVPRHPSQLYEALLEGVVLSIVLWAVDRRSHAQGWYRAGLLTGTFIVGYAALRFLVEFTREPDAQLGLVLGPFSMGQLLSALMLLVGILVLAISWRGVTTRGPSAAS